MHFRHLLSQLSEGHADLFGLELVVFTKHVDEVVALLPLPHVVGDVTGGVE